MPCASSFRSYFLSLILLSPPIWGEALGIGNFSAESPDAKLPSGWQPLEFKKIKRHTQYLLVREDGKIVVKAVANNAAAGLVKNIEVSAKDYPILAWSWKVENVVAKGDPKRKEGDDYAARIYVTFKYDPEKASAWQRTKYRTAKLLYGQFPPHAGINYIWDANLPKDAALRNAYTDRLQMIVVESGNANLGHWQRYERNLYEDYKRAFGEEPPPISGIAIMTDTDNTGEAATAFYGDIVLKTSGE
jgi:hypothetical protein